MPTTTNEHISYPAGTVGVPPDVRGDLQSLATTADTAIHSARATANQGGLDTGWALSPITLASGWGSKTDPAGNTSGSLVGGVRTIGSIAYLKFRVKRTGSTINAGSGGNVSPDVLIATLSAPYRPATVSYNGVFVLPGVYSGQVRLDFDGSLTLTNFLSGGPVTGGSSGDVIQVEVTAVLG